MNNIRKGDQVLLHSGNKVKIEDIYYTGTGKSVFTYVNYERCEEVVIGSKEIEFKLERVKHD